MAFPITRIKNWIAEVCTFGDLNAEIDNIITGLIPANIDDESSNLAAMQGETDPYPGAVASLPTNLQGELQRQRYQINQLLAAINTSHDPASAYWYEDPIFAPQARVANPTTTYTILETDTCVLADALAGAFTVTLPTAVDNGGKLIEIIKIDTSANHITIDANGAETIGDAAQQYLYAEFDAIVLRSTGAHWHIVSVVPARGSEGHFKKLHVYVASLRSVTIDADYATLSKAAGGDDRSHETINVTVDFATNGANGLDTGSLAANTPYYLYLASDGTTICGIASLSGTWAGVTKPTGYDFGLLVSWCVSDATVSPFAIEAFNQYDDEYVFNIAQKVEDSGGSTTTAGIDLSSGGDSTYDVVPPLGFCKAVYGKVMANTGALTWFANPLTFTNTLAVDNNAAEVSIFLAAATASANWILRSLTGDQTFFHQASANDVDVWVTGFKLFI